MKFLKKSENKRVRGAELVLTGGALIFSKFLLGWIAPLALVGFGLYRWLVRKSYAEGVVIMAVGMLLWVLLKFTLLSWILWIPMTAGIFVLIYGAFLMISGGKSKDVS